MNVDFDGGGSATESNATLGKVTSAKWNQFDKIADAHILTQILYNP